MIAAQSAGAADYYWNGGSSSWETSGSWLLAGGGAGAIPTALDTAHFSYSATGATETIALSSGSWNALGLVFESNHTGATVIESSKKNSTRTLNIGSSGIVVNSGAGAVTIGDGSREVDIDMQDAQSWTNDSTNPLSIVNYVTNNGYTLTLDGTGNALTTLSGGLGFSGAGGLIINKSGALGTLISGGTITLGGTGGITINSGASAVTLGAASISAIQSWTNNSNAALTTAGILALYNQVSLTAGSVVFGNYANTGAGGVVVDGATVQAGNDAAFGTGTLTLTNGELSSTGATARAISNAVSINGSVSLGDATNNGALTFSGTKSITGNNTITLGGGNVAFTTGAMSLPAGSNTTFNSTGAGLTMSGGFNTNGGTATLTLNTTTSGTSISGPLSGTGGTLVLTGTGTNVTLGALTGSNNSVLINSTTGGSYTLSGASTYTGGTTLTSGTLIVNNAGVAGTSGALGNGGTFTINGGTIDTVAAGVTNANINPITLANNFTFGGTGNLNLGTGAIANAGNRTITLNGTNKTLTMGGVMTNSSGGVQTTTVNGAGNTLSLGGYALSNSATNFTNVITGTGNVTITGVVSNGGTSTAGGLTYSGSGTLALGGANTYAGVTTISAGDLRVQNNTALGTTTGGTTVASGAAIQINGSGLNVAEAVTSLVGDGGGTGALQNLANSNTWSGAITLGTGGARINSDAGTLTLTGGIIGAGNALSVGGAGNVTVSTNAIAGTNTTLTKDGAGTLTLSVANTFSGLTTLSSGTLAFGVSDALAAGDVTVAGGTLNIGAFSDTVGGVTLSTGSITGSTGVLTGTSYNLTNTGTVSAILAGAGPLTKTGAGTATLSGVNTYTGLTTVSEGTLALGVNNALSSGAVTVAGGTLNVATFTDTVGAVTLSSGSITGTTGVLTGTTYSLTNTGTVSAILAGTGSLTKTGGGTATLSGANTYTGGTIVSGGTLTLDYTTVGSKLADTGVLTLSGGTLNLANGASSHTEVVASTTIAAGSSSVTRSSGTSVLQQGTITRNIGGTVNYGAAGIATANGTLTVGTNPIIPWATINGAGWATKNTSTNGSITALATYASNFGATANNVSISGNLTQAGATVNSLRMNGSTAQTLTVSSGTITLTSGGLLTTGAGTKSITGGTLRGSATELIVHQYGGDLTIGSVISGAALTKTGPGTLILTGANTYTGTTNVSGGMLQVGNGSTTGSLPTSGSIAINNGGNLTFNRTNTLTQGTDFASVISGTGSVTQAGSGTLALNGTNTYSGGTTVSNGTLLVGHNAALGSGAVNLGATSGSNNAAILLDAAGRSLQTNITVRDTTSGTLTLGGTNTTGTASYDSSITLGSTANAGKSVTLSAAAGGTVAFNGSILKNGTDTTAGVNAVNSTGSGNASIVLGGNNTYAGGTIINPNVTVVSPATDVSINTLGTGTTTLSGGTLALQGKTSFGQAVNQASTGWNSDVILATTDVSTSAPTWGGTVSFDVGASSSGAAYIQNGYGASGNVGLITTAFTSRISNSLVGKESDAMKSSFQLRPFTAANALVMTSSNPSPTLTLTTPTAFHDISILASSAGITDRNPTPTVTLHFSDGSTVSTTIIAYDWYLNTPGQEAARAPYQALPNTVSRWNMVASGAGTLDTGGGANFGMYETDINLSNINGVNYSGKMLTSLTFHDDFGQTANTYEAVFAVSGAINTLNAAQIYSNNVVVSADSSINISGSLAASMGTLGIGSQKLSVTSADTTANPYSLTLGASTLSGNPAFDVANSSGGGTGTLLLGALNDSGTGRTITKQGAGSLTLGTAATSLGNGTALNITAGTVNSNQTTALGNLAAVSVSSGATFNAGASQTLGSLSGGGSTTLGANTLTVGSANNLSSTFSGSISGSGGNLVKAASGTLTLTGTSTYSGTTTVSDGKLVIGSTGTINSTSGVSIGAAEFNYNSGTALSQPVTFSGTGGTLSGTGTITPGFTVTSGNTYTPGTVEAMGGGTTGVGTQTLSGAVTFNPGSIFEWDFAAPTTDPGAGATNAGSYDKVVANGAVTGNAVFNVVLGSNVFSDSFWNTNKSWTDIFTTIGGGTFALETLFTSFGGVNVQPSGTVHNQGYFTTTGNTLNWTAVPEPTSAMVGLLLAAGLHRRKRK